MTTAFIALGANLGDRKANIERAVELLTASGDIAVTGLSQMIESKPLDGADQPDYIDAVARVQTELTAAELFDRMRSVEDDLQRVRRRKWGPRTIDLDLLLYGDEIIESPVLTVPHKQMHLRSFVLEGMCQLAPDVVHPVLKRSMKQLARRLNGGNFFPAADRAQLISVAGVIGVGKSTLASGLAAVLGCQMIPEAYDTNPYMADVYAGKKELALDSQLYFLDSRVEQLHSGKLDVGVPVVTDYVFDKEMIYARRTLAPEQLESYKQKYKKVVADVTKPVVVVYLHDTSAACLNRIAARNRPYEKEIDLGVLEAFAEDYERLFADWKQCPLIRLDAGSFNCIDPEQVKSFADELGHYIWK